MTATTPVMKQHSLFPERSPEEIAALQEVRRQMRSMGTACTQIDTRSARIPYCGVFLCEVASPDATRCFVWTPIGRTANSETEHGARWNARARGAQITEPLVLFGDGLGEADADKDWVQIFPGQGSHIISGRLVGFVGFDGVLHDLGRDPMPLTILPPATCSFARLTPGTDLEAAVAGARQVYGEDCLVIAAKGEKDPFPYALYPFEPGDGTTRFETISPDDLRPKT